MRGMYKDISSTIIQNHTEATGGPVFPDDVPAIYHILPSTFDIWSYKNATIKTSVGANWIWCTPGSQQIRTRRLTAAGTYLRSTRSCTETAHARENSIWTVRLWL